MATNHSSNYRLTTKAIQLGFNNLWRNKFLSLATIFVIGTILFIFNIMLNIKFVANESLTEIGQKVDINIYLKETVDPSDINELIKIIGAHQGVENITYISKDDALEKLKLTQPDLSTAFEKYNLENPLPASISIQVKSPTYFEELNTFLSQDRFTPYFALLNTSENNSIIDSISTNLSNISGFVTHLILWLVITLIIGGTLIIFNAIKITIHNRKQEIQIMKLVGAPYWFIRLPFIIESVLYVLLAVTLSTILFQLLIDQINTGTTPFFQHLNRLNFIKITLIETILVVIIAIFSSQLSLHQTLKSKISATHS
ncbi:hypothetical protein CVV38_03840 [Candidatus Peregrinibacteria bacterium HGW-Peregrinibacteria-1]|jgi:cell division transport system permease protein|nr:MAG: hypothetical protein CVV38_03840 [Candidatus Peregrinibacteria bacterium HGW-Peregrinibacteria-1]